MNIKNMNINKKLKALTDKPKNFTLMLYETGSKRKRIVYRVETSKIRRFRARFRRIPDQFDGYLRVSYTGGGHNDGDYCNKADLIFAFEAFVEK